jgi:hypothetical protein
MKFAALRVRTSPILWLVYARYPFGDFAWWHHGPSGRAWRVRIASC